MIIPCVWEHNGSHTLLYADSLPGAFARGEFLDIALEKMPAEVRSYLTWAGLPVPDGLEIRIVAEKASELKICDADSDVLFPSETAPLTMEQYHMLKEMALKSAKDFLSLYRSIPDQDTSSNLVRQTFYGPVPRTAREMYEHTKNVNGYYFAEIDIPADNEGDILQCRQRGFVRLEQMPEFLENKVISGSYGEDWTLRKVLRRFIWHDRIHAKAMYRMAVKAYGRESIPNPFSFSE